MPETPSKYIGRFAPTPSGPLHFGSIIAALGSYLDARANKGLWLVRIDDLDTPRVRAGADDKILHGLDKLGMHWDESILYQSRRQQAYQMAMAELQSRDLLFPCYCSRNQILGKRYPGTCRGRHWETGQRHAIRIRTETGNYTLQDQIQPAYSEDVSADVGDFIIKRSDGIYAYHLAVVVDDAYQNISHMIRGADLMDSCPVQIYLQQQLGLPTPIYAHLPLAITAAGEKISKQYLAEDVLLNSQPGSVLFTCLDFLGQKPDKQLLHGSVDEIIGWAIDNWSLSTVPKQMKIIAPAHFQSPVS